MPETERAGRPAIDLPYAEFVAIIAMLMALNAAALDIILPALQEMGAALAVEDENSRQLALTAYIITFGLSQMVYGPLSDRYGRRPVLFFGLLIYVAGSLGAALAGGFFWLLLLRAIQGVGAGATRTIAIAVVRDTCRGREMAAVMSLAMMVFMAVPIFAPSLGQVVLMVAGWRAILVMIAGVGLIMVAWTRLRLPETLAPENRRPLEARKIAEAFRIVLTNRVAGTYAVAIGLIFGTLFAFLNSAQQVYQEVYGLGALFPVAFSAGAAVIAVAAFLNARLVRRHGMRFLAHTAHCGFALSSALLLVLSAGGHPPFPVFFVLLTVIFGCFSFLGTNYNALAMDPLGHVAGTASALLGTLQTFLGGVIGAAIGLAYDGTIRPMMMAFVVLSVLSLAVVAWGDQGRLFGREEPQAAE